MPKSKDKQKKAPKPKPSDLGTGQAARAAAALQSRAARNQAALDAATKALRYSQATDDHQ